MEAEFPPGHWKSACQKFTVYVTPEQLDSLEKVGRVLAPTWWGSHEVSTEEAVQTALQLLVRALDRGQRAKDVWDDAREWLTRAMRNF